MVRETLSTCGSEIIPVIYITLHDGTRLLLEVETNYLFNPLWDYNKTPIGKLEIRNGKKYLARL